MMKPTVGRAVHFYGRKTLWHGLVASSLHPALTPGAKYQGFVGPFHATIVFVHEDGGVNLSVSHPVPGSRAYDLRDVTTEIVCGVPFSEEPKDEHWTWPPRV